ncbi:MAG TPA: hypothetical protein VGG42_09985 [Acidobacteriaceae bacterium]|jgi:hypothetical protein
MSETSCCGQCGQPFSLSGDLYDEDKQDGDLCELCLDLQDRHVRAMTLPNGQRCRERNLPWPL